MEWEPYWAPRYRKSLETYLQPYQERYKQSPSADKLTSNDISEIDMLVAPAASLQPKTTATDELTQYLGSSKLIPPYLTSLASLILTLLGTVQATPLMYWKEHQQEYPILASIARDVLITSASSSGIEQLFNSARDICHYRRGSLKPQTIQDLMMFMCTVKFDLETEQFALIEEYLSTQEKQAERERKDAIKKQEEEFNTISDNEKGLSTTESSQAVPLPNAKALGKRRATSDDLIKLDDDGEIPLPENQHVQGESSTQRRSSGRVPKRPRQDEDFVYS